MAKDIADTVVPIKNFDPNNDEHLYVLAIARAMGGVLGVQVAVEMPFYRRWKMNRAIKLKTSKLLPYKKEYDEHAVDPDKLLESIREWASDLNKTFLFNFGKIYHEFYERKEQ